MRKITKKMFLLTLLSIMFNSMLFAADIHVDASATGAGDGSSQADAFTTLSAAISAAVTGDQVLVYGTLTPAAKITINPGGNFELTIKGVGSDAIIDCSSKSSGALFDLYKLLILENLTIKNSTSTTTGGVVFIRNSGAVVATSCRFEGNSATDGGVFRANQSNGGVAAAYSSVTGGYSVLVDKCLFKGNSASGKGGAIRMNSYGVLKITNSTFVDNFAAVNGGAISLNASYDSTKTTSDILRNVTIFDNYVTASVGDRAGGLDSQAASTASANVDSNGLLLENTIIYGNYRGGDGVTAADMSTLKFTSGGVDYSTTTTVKNSLIGVSFASADPGAPTITNTDSNLSADLSASALTYDDSEWVVKFSSVGGGIDTPIDFGDSSYLTVLEDQNGNPRSSGSIDAGAWESGITLSLDGFEFSDNIGGFYKTTDGYKIIVKKEAKAELYNFLGAKVEGFTVKGSYGILDSKYASGVYILKLTIDGRSFAKKFIVN
ncbi:T9SS type A sorting domain-containing protein [Ochrovirga pacifica]|uniref:T9SS type A sorting domain-containing protein n=1 Tax=Ochrovirga pacifica TaxID=1042376 RepID=UPI000255A554|nr:T9SS type A sorting domain-containing protein [Ochrovirga pacifica]